MRSPAVRPTVGRRAVTTKRKLGTRGALTLAARVFKVRAAGEGLRRHVEQQLQR